MPDHVAESVGHQPRLLALHHLLGADLRLPDDPAAPVLHPQNRGGDGADAQIGERGVRGDHLERHDVGRADVDGGNRRDPGGEPELRRHATTAGSPISIPSFTATMFRDR